VTAALVVTEVVSLPTNKEVMMYVAILSTKIVDVRLTVDGFVVKRC